MLLEGVGGHQIGRLAPIGADLMPNCIIFGLGVFGGPHSWATATHLNSQSQKSAVHKLIALISKVQLARWDTRMLTTVMKKSYPTFTIAKCDACESIVHACAEVGLQMSLLPLVIMSSPLLQPYCL